MTEKWKSSLALKSMTEEKMDEMRRMTSEDLQKGCYKSVGPFKTSVYIPVSIADKEVESHERVVRERNIKVSPTITREEAVQRIKNEIDTYWTVIYSCYEYQTWKNSITKETRKQVFHISR